MRWGVVLALGAAVLSGCPARVAVYAPRLHNTGFHREAVEKKSCRDCHEPGKIRDHRAEDDCTSCHAICRGC